MDSITSCLNLIATVCTSASPSQHGCTGRWERKPRLGLVCGRGSNESLSYLSSSNENDDEDILRKNGSDRLLSLLSSSGGGGGSAAFSDVLFTLSSGCNMIDWREGGGGIIPYPYQYYFVVHEASSSCDMSDCKECGGGISI